MHDKNRITLATLPQATPQEVADQIVQHLLTQGRKCAVVADEAQRKSTTSNTVDCRYRDGTGAACAGGCLISDTEYRETMENLLWSDVGPEAHRDLVAYFQTAHDGCEIVDKWDRENRYRLLWDADEWPEMLATVCYAHGLEFNPPAGWVDPREVTQ